MLKVNEIFTSIQGETTKFQGMLSLFVRLAGCNRTCVWCDENNRKDSKIKLYTVPHLIHKCDKLLTRHMCLTITGGEPLIQQMELTEFLTTALTVWEYPIVLQTNGDIPIPNRLLKFTSLYPIVSPKDLNFKQRQGEELNVVYTGKNWEFIKVLDVLRSKQELNFIHYKITPVNNDIILAQDLINSKLQTLWNSWSLGLQIHKVIAVK
jgi:7-carboxy-7-deazaguanine synthase